MADGRLVSSDWRYESWREAQPSEPLIVPSCDLRLVPARSEDRAVVRVHGNCPPDPRHLGEVTRLSLLERGSAAVMEAYNKTVEGLRECGPDGSDVAVVACDFDTRGWGWGDASFGPKFTGMYFDLGERIKRGFVHSGRWPRYRVFMLCRVQPPAMCEVQRILFFGLQQPKHPGEKWKWLALGRMLPPTLPDSQGPILIG